MNAFSSFIASLFSTYQHHKNSLWINNPVKSQNKIFNHLIIAAKNTSFGKDHNFNSIKTYTHFKQNVFINNYEDLEHYINKIKNGEKNVLWKGVPLYFAKTSGTTSGAKYIPISKESMPYHISIARDMLLNYIYETKNSTFATKKLIFLQGSPILDKVGNIPTGRLSGIVARFVPSYLQKNRKPSWETNCIEDWEVKINAIVKETLNEDMSLISGIPPWLQMYFEKLIEQSRQPVGLLFKNLDLIITGGVNYEPYKKKMNELLGRNITVLQTYPASEGFIAYQNKLEEEGLLLMLNHGIFYEFIPVDEINATNPSRFSIGEVELHKEYAIILNTNAGLWGYNIGDTVKFISKNPYRILVTGRTKHFTSAFGEHVIAFEVEKSLQNTLLKHNCTIIEFTVAPQVNPENGLPFHEWFIEFDTLPNNLVDFKLTLDQELRALNTYYDDLIVGKILKPLQITLINKNGFNLYMKSIGKLGGQNKIQRLSNDRVLADQLLKLNLTNNA